MNREQRRKMNFTENQGKMYDELVMMARIKKMKDDWKPIPEGTKVKLNFKVISSHPDYSRLRPEFRAWVESNLDTEFTVEYDEKHKINPTLVGLKEDTSIPKWLFDTSDLIIIENKEKLK